MLPSNLSWLERFGHAFGLPPTKSSELHHHFSQSEIVCVEIDLKSNVVG